METVVNGIENKLTKLLTKVRKVFPYADIERVYFNPDRVVFMMDCRPENSVSVLEYDFADNTYYYSGDFYKHLKDIKKTYKNEHRPCDKRKSYKIKAYINSRMAKVITKVKEV